MKHTYSWHMYANTTNPFIYIALFFAPHMMSHPKIIFGDCKPFEGNLQYDRLINIFSEVVKDIQYEFFSLES